MLQHLADASAALTSKVASPRRLQNMHSALHHQVESVLQDLPYWGSWAIAHFTQLAATAALCALMLIYPLPKSRR